MRVVFMGTPRFAVPSLEAILAAGHKVVSVYTRRPAPGGRRNLLIEQTPIHRFAETFGLGVRTPSTLREPEELGALRDLRPDVVIVAAYGLILPKTALDVPLLGCWNLHASLLPRWRGAAPIQRAILAGDAEAGACLMRMNAGLDTGPVAGEWRTTIAKTETASELSERIGVAGAQLLVRSLRTLADEGLLLAQQATDGITYAKKIDKREALVRWDDRSHEICRKVNALSPAPGAYAMIMIGGKHERVKLLRAEQVAGHGNVGELIDEDMTVASGDGAVRVVQAQRSGKNVVTGRELLAGARLRVGDNVIGSLD